MNNTAKPTENDAHCTSPKKNVLLKGVFGNWAALAVNVIIGFVLTPYIVGHVGKNDFGLFKLVASVIGYYGVVEMGVRSAVDRYVARSLGQNDTGNLNRVVSTAMVFYGGISILILIFMLVSPSLLIDFFNLEGNDAVKFKYMLWITGASFSITVIGAVFTSVLLGHEKFLVVSAIQVIRNIIRAALTVIAINCGRGIISVSAINMFELLLATILWAIFSYRFTPGLSIKLGYAQLKTMRTLFLFGLASILLTLNNLIKFQLDNIVIAKWLSAERIAVYAIAIVLTKHINNLMQAATNVFMPRFSRLSNQEDSAQEKITLYQRGLLYSSFFCCTISCGLLFGGKAFIRCWMGEGFEDTYPVLFTLMISGIISQSQMPTIHLLRAENKHYLAGIMQIPESIANVIISIALVQTLGILGVALGTTIPMVVVMLFVYPRIASKVSGLSLYNYYRNIIPAILLSIPFVIISWYGVLPDNVEEIITLNNIPSPRWVAFGLIVASSVIYACVYAACCLCIIFPKAEKHFILDRIKAVYRKVNIVK